MSTTSTKRTSRKTPRREPREGSTMWAAMQVLRGKRKPMTAAEIYAEIREQKLAPRLKGKTPETIAAQLAVNAKQGRYVERTEPGKDMIVQQHARGAASRLMLR